MSDTDEKPDRDMVKLATYWKTQLEAAKKSDEDFTQNGERTVARYKDERRADKGRSKYNILWSNTQTLLPAVYSRTPKAEAKRRNDGADPVARTAAALIERALQYELDVYPDFSEAMTACVTDWLLPGRGTAWVRFEANDEGKECRSCVDYVFWKDFRHAPARLWGDVPWQARRTYVSRKDGIKRWGESFKDVPLTFEPIGLPEMKDRNASETVTDAMKKAQIWEIWDKDDREVVWIAEGHPKALQVADDPYELDEFFPTPKPLFATQTTDTLSPVADFIFYRDQALELDQITTKIDQLTHALKVVGMYDAANTDLKNLLSTATNNQMVPVQTWAAFAERGGINGAVQFLPLQEVVAALQQLYLAREQVKGVIYEITGISDIIRGATDAQETATAQNIKRQFGSLRLKPRQQAVAMFASQILRIKAQLMMDKYPDEQIVEMSDMQQEQAQAPQAMAPGMPPQMPGQPPQPGMQPMPQPAEGDAQFISQALALIKQEPMRVYRIQVDADSLIEIDEEQEKESRTEFLAAAGQYLNQVLPIAKEVPQLVPLLSEMLMFGVRAYKTAEPIEQAFQSAMDALRQPQPPKPDPEMAKVQAQQQQAQQQMQADQAKAQMQAQVDTQIAQMKAQTDSQIQMARAQADTQVEQVRIQSQAALERERTQNQMQLEQFKHESQLQHQFQLETQKTAFDKWKAELDAATKIEVANISSKAKMQDAATDTATKEIASEVTQ